MVKKSVSKSEPIKKVTKQAELSGDIRKETRWLNKQRTMIFCSKGVTHRFRQLTMDIQRMMPHHKKDFKFEKKQKMHSAKEVCELENCNNCLYLEARKHKNAFLFMSRIPTGPTIKFQLFNSKALGFY